MPDLRIASAVYHKTTTDVDTTGTWNHHNPLTLLDENIRRLHRGDSSQRLANQERNIARPIADGALSVTGVPLGSIITTSGSLLDHIDVIDIDVVPSPSVNRLFQDIAKPNGIKPVQFVRSLVAKDSGGSLHLEALESLAHDLFDTTQNRLEVPWSLRRGLKELDAEIRLHASNRIFFITDTSATGLSYHPDSLDGIRVGDEMAELFTSSDLLSVIPFVLGPVDGAKCHRMINVASFEPRIIEYKQDGSCDGEPNGASREPSYAIRSYAII